MKQPHTAKHPPGAPRRRLRLRLRRREEEYYDDPFEGPARFLLAKGVHPNHFTFLQVPVYVLEIVAALNGWRWTFVLSTFFVILLDGGDGVLARVGKLQTKTGAVLDSTFDTLGIAIVMWGATRFFPAEQAWFMFLFLGNIVLYLQNAMLGRKVIAYIRGPVLTAIAFPAALYGCLIVATIIVTWLLAVRMPATWRALTAAPQPPATP